MQPKRHRPNGPAEGLEAIVHRLAGAAYRRWPRSIPSRRQLENCRIVAHRGEHDNCERLENTLAAFDAAADAGVWGIELDIRWSRDGFPVVFHDPDTRRLFNSPTRIADLSLGQIRRRFPMIPALSEVVARFGGRVHLMMEVKAAESMDPALERRRLQQIIRHLRPQKEFHLMALQPELFDRFDFLPPGTFLPIARIRMDRFSRLAATRGWGGVAGQFLLAGQGIIERHHRLGQGVGTGFADSRRCLYREAARGVDWIFSNRAVRMQAFCRPGPHSRTAVSRHAHH